MRRFRQWAPPVLFFFSLCMGFYALGVGTGARQWFPFEHFRSAKRLASSLVNPEPNWYYKRLGEGQTPQPVSGQTDGPGLNIVTCVSQDNSLSVKVVDMGGKTVHEWAIDWFDIWPDATHIPGRLVPQQRPGTHVHGAVVLEDGSLIFNFEYLGLVRLDARGKVMWRLPYQTHHSIHMDGEDLWVCGQIEREEPLGDYPNFEPPFVEDTILKVSRDGKILEEVSVLKLLRQNGLSGLLYIGTRFDTTTSVTGDVLHLNDVEIYPEDLEEGFFSHGDVMVSLRNINTVLVFDPADWSVKFRSTGQFVRQHDPDFIDESTISIFDNNSVDQERRVQSRILFMDARSGKATVKYQGDPLSGNPFFTVIMGKHQWLPDGNLLITESMNGRAFEVDPSGDIRWEYRNLLPDNWLGMVEEVSRLSPQAAGFFRDNGHLAQGGSEPKP